MKTEFLINTIAAESARSSKVSAGDSLLIALIGVMLVFVVLIVLMLIIQGTGYLFDKAPKFKAKHPELLQRITKLKNVFRLRKNKTKAEPALPDIQENQVTEIAKGTYGELKLINTDEREAAMIMAIVADETQTPLNELRFVSIKRIDGGDIK